VNLPRLHQLNLLLIIGAFIATLFFNGFDIRFFAFAYILLLGWLFANGISIYSNGYSSGNLLLPVSMVLFWLWLGINILSSQVFYLSVVNFWWVGVFPLGFLAYTLSADKNQFWRFLFAALVVSIAVLCLYALYQIFILHDQPRATFYNKNSLAALINLLLLPLLASFIDRSNRTHIYSTLGAVFLFSLVLSLINSRGALLAFVIGLVFILLLSIRQLSKHRLLLVGLIIVSAFATAQLLLEYTTRTIGTGMADRILTLQDPQSAGHLRFVIWQPAWDLFLQHRWTGIGLGVYFLAIPPTLHPEDISAGFYVHNDYLQLALETGIPGLLLFVLILLATLFRLVISLRNASTEHSERVELAGLFAALLALSLHSAFTYNLYVMPIMLIAGLLLGRFNQLSNVLAGKPLIVLRPVRLFRPFVYYTLLSIIIVTVASYFLRIGVAHHYKQRGYVLAARNQLEDAHHAFRIAQKLAPSVDSAYYADADLLRKSAKLLADRPELAQRLLQEAKVLLTRAEELNPLRAQTPYIHGLLLEQTSPTEQTKVIEAYQTALQRNPRFLPARLALARYLLAQDKQEQAQQILWEGLGYSYRQLSPAYLELLEMSSVLAEQTGFHEIAARLSDSLEQSRHDYAAMLSNQRSNKIINPY
jgi:O-antigen ligase